MKRPVTLVLATLAGFILCALWFHYHFLSYSDRERHIVKGDREILAAARAVLDSPLDNTKQDTLRELISRDLPRGATSALVERYIEDNFEDVDLTHERGVPPWDFDYYFRVPVLSRSRPLAHDELTIRFYIVDGKLSDVKISASGAAL